MAKEASSSFFGNVRDFFAAVREIAIVAIMVTLFVQPQYVGRTLYQAGITSLFGIDLDMERFAQAQAEAASAGQTVKEVSSELSSLRQQLEDLSNRNEPDLAEIKKLSVTAKTLDDKAQRAKTTLDHSTAIQADLLKSLPTRMRVVGEDNQ